MLRPRARDLGVPFHGDTGAFNAITDVPGVTVGHCTLVNGAAGPCLRGKGPIRTGVTAIFPSGSLGSDGVAANWFSLNGIGELTGAHFIKETGVLNGPILLTNSLSIGIVHQAVLEWHLARETDDAALFAKTIPVIGETWDGRLNDIYGQHITKSHVFDALRGARSGPVDEGNVGGGTGMVCYEFKGGIGTASRIAAVNDTEFIVAALVQANHGSRRQLSVAGAPVGYKIGDDVPIPALTGPNGNSIIIIVATNAPLLPLHLEAVCKRAALGLARTGAIAEESSGDIILSFSTALKFQPSGSQPTDLSCLPFSSLNPIFEGAIHAVEEAVINSLVAAETMAGVDDLTVHALPHDRLQTILRAHNLLAAKTN